MLRFCMVVPDPVVFGISTGAFCMFFLDLLVRSLAEPGSFFPPTSFAPDFCELKSVRSKWSTTSARPSPCPHPLTSP